MAQLEAVATRELAAVGNVALPAFSSFSKALSIRLLLDKEAEAARAVMKEGQAEEAAAALWSMGTLHYMQKKAEEVRIMVKEGLATGLVGERAAILAILRWQEAGGGEACCILNGTNHVSKWLTHRN